MILNLEFVWVSLAVMLSLCAVAWVGQWGQKNLFGRVFVLGLTALCGLACLLVGGIIGLLPQLDRHMAFPDDVRVIGRMLLWVGALALPCLLPPVRRVLAKTVFRGLDVDNPAHTWSLFVFFGAFVVTFTFIRDLYSPETIIESLKAIPMSLSAMLNAVCFMIFAFVGCGVGLGKSFGQTARELGLGTLPWRTVTTLIGVALVLAVGIQSLETVITPLVPLNQLHDLQRVIEALKPPPGAEATLVSAALVGLAAGVGEEVLFRGMMQPVFGIVPTALLFTLIHTHYGFTFFLLELLIVGLLLGYIRQRLNTTASIIVHSGFDFFVLASSLLPT